MRMSQAAAEIFAQLNKLGTKQRSGKYDSELCLNN